MSDQEESTTQTNDKLLTEEERDVCQKIAKLDAGLSSQRAATLLIVDDGLTPATAAEQTGLTLGQIRYLITAFRKKRLGLFPDDVLSQVQSATETIEPVEAEAEVQTEKTAKKIKKAKKSKAAKAKKKEKKAKAKAKGKKKTKKSKKGDKAKKKKSKK